MRFVAVVFLAFIASAFGAVKYASNVQSVMAAATTNAAALAGVTATAPVGPPGTMPETAFEWFFYKSTTVCYQLWTTSTTDCGALPASTDDVILGRGLYPYTTAAQTYTLGQEYTGISGGTLQSLFFSFNSPRLNCLLASNPSSGAAASNNACAGMTTYVAPATVVRNADINSLSLYARITALATNAYLAPIIFTGYPVTSGTYAADGSAWTVTASSRLAVRSAIYLRQTNTAIYGSGYGVSLGGLDPTTTGGSQAYGNGYFSADDTYGGSDAAYLNRAGARNALSTTETVALAWWTANQATAAAQNNKTGFGFVVETPSIVVDPCSYTDMANTRCIGGYAASEIQGPNLYIQPYSGVAVTDPVNINTTTGAGSARVNITITSRSILFTTSTVYINADFRVQLGGALAFCEPIHHDASGGVTANGFGNQVQATSANIQTTTTVAAVSFSGATPLQTWCAPVATNAYDWFGIQFTSVRLFNDNPAGSTSLLYANFAPNVAKLAITYGPLYSIPIVGNVTLSLSAAGAAASSVNAATEPLTTTDDQSLVGLATVTPYGVVSNAITQTPIPRFLGLSIPETSTNPTLNSYVNTYDCSSPYETTGTTTATAESPLGEGDALCRGHPIPSRFTFFGGVSTLLGGAANYQMVFLTQFDQIAVGDGIQNSTLAFQGSYSLCGTFGTRTNGVLSFPAEGTVLPLSLGLRSTPGARRVGQGLSNFVATRTTTVVTGSTVNPTPDFATATTGLLYTTSLASYIPISTTEVATCWPVSLTIPSVTTAGAGCYAGTYSYLFTGPYAAAIRPAVFQINCANGACAATTADVAVVDRGCYDSQAAAGGAVGAGGTALTVQNTTSTVGMRGYCTTPPVIKYASAAAANLKDVAGSCTGTSIVGLQGFPSTSQSPVAAGSAVFAKAFTVDASNVTFLATTVRSTGGLTINDRTDVESVNGINTQQLPSSLLVAAGANLVNDGGVLSTGTLSSVTIAGASLLTVSGGSVGAGTFVVNGAANFVGSSAAIATGTGRTLITGTGVIAYTGATAVTTTGFGTNVGVFSQVNTFVNGSLDIQGQYAQQGGNITIASSGAIGSSGAGRLTLSNAATLVFNGGSITTQNLANTLQIAVADASSSVVISAGNTTLMTAPLLITAVNTTATAVYVQGTLATVNVQLTLATNALVTGTLGGASSTVVIGTASGVSNVVTLSGASAAISGVFRLYPNSQIVNQGTATVAAGTTLDSVAATQTNITALFNQGTLVLAGAFSPNVDVINSGSIVVNSTQALTIGANRALRLQGGSVSGSGQVIITGSATAETGSSSLTPATLVNNGVITVNSGAILTVTSCLTGTGSLVGSGQVIYQGQAGCSVNGYFNNLVLSGNSTVNGGLTVITGQLNGNSTIAAGTGYISINNDNALALVISGTTTVGAASATNVVTLSGTVTVNSGAVFTIGQAVVGIRNPTTFAINSNGVVFTLASGQLNLLSSLIVPVGATFRTTGTISGGSLTVNGTLTLTGATAFTGTVVQVGAGARVNSTSIGNVLTLNAGSSLVVSPNAVFGGFTLTVAAGASFSFAGSFTGATTVNGLTTLSSSIVVNNGASVTFNNLVVCAPGVTVSTNGTGAVNFAGAYTGCMVSGNVQGSPSNANGATVTVISGSLVLTPGASSLTIGTNVTVVINGATVISCNNGGNPAITCTILVNGGNLTIVFAPLCSNGLIPNFRNTSGTCGPNGLTGAVYATVGVIINVQSGDFWLVSGNANNITINFGVQDLPTYPIGTVDSLQLNPLSRTVVVTTGNNVNPLIVRNQLRLDGYLEVRTMTFVPLRPVVIIRLANTSSVITGPGFNRVAVTYDQSRSSHNFAWNVGFPTVRVVGRDVILDPNGAGNSAAGVAPSFFLALLAVIAAFLFRN